MKKILLQLLAITAILALVSSCQYKWNLEPVVPPPEPGDTVSFSLQVEPIWGEQGCTGCHNTGGTPPDLTVGNSYESIMSMGLVDTADPPASKIYYYPLPDGNHYAKYTSTQAATVLLWIEEGAKDN
jgi:hypothetical protein